MGLSWDPSHSVSSLAVWKGECALLSDLQRPQTKRKWQTMENIFEEKYSAGEHKVLKL